VCSLGIGASWSREGLRVLSFVFLLLREFERFEFSEHQASPERRRTCQSPVFGVQGQLQWCPPDV
jgi:hypothetical protein